MSFLNPGDVLRLQALRPLLYLEFHFRAFIQASIAGGLNRGKMNEHVIAARPLDESIAFSGIEPLHGTIFLHYTFS